MIFIVMGVSASGKSEVSEELAKAIGGEYLDADDFHMPENKAKMEHHHPLSDADRAPWLAILRGLIDERLERPQHTVLACSALKRVYRYQLRPDQKRVVLVYLKGDPEGIYEHIKSRKHAYFRGLDMLINQLCTLEEPEAWENACVLDRASEDWAALAARARAHFGV